jgi:hypothetical protein
MDLRATPLRRVFLFERLLMRERRKFGVSSAGMRLAESAGRRRRKSRNLHTRQDKCQHLAGLS